MPQKKKCDNTSSGVIFENFLLGGDDILLIKRFNYPEAIALPAGHLDGDDPISGAERESAEEVGLFPGELKMVFNGDISNPCKRDGGNHHYWFVFKAGFWNGKLKAGSDAKETFWASKDELIAFARRTEYFMKKYNAPYNEVGRLTFAIFGDPEQKNTDPEWKEKPGLEPVWYKILKELKII